MSKRGNQATFILPQEPQGHMPLTTKMVRGGDKDRKERVTVFYHRNYKAFAISYNPKSEGLVYQLSDAKSVQELVYRLGKMGFTVL